MFLYQGPCGHVRSSIKQWWMREFLLFFFNPKINGKVFCIISAMFWLAVLDQTGLSIIKEPSTVLKWEMRKINNSRCHGSTENKIKKMRDSRYQRRSTVRTENLRVTNAGSNLVFLSYCSKLRKLNFISPFRNKCNVMTTWNTKRLFNCEKVLGS